uniref:Uncharacterized protein n=1 Tax=Arundo donax TaxID=35708 RepID=A0A0A9EBK1_ARUDO
MQESKPKTEGLIKSNTVAYTIYTL